MLFSFLTLSFCFLILLLQMSRTCDFAAEGDLMREFEMETRQIRRKKVEIAERNAALQLQQQQKVEPSAKDQVKHLLIFCFVMRCLLLPFFDLI